MNHATPNLLLVPQAGAPVIRLAGSSPKRKALVIFPGSATNVNIAFGNLTPSNTIGWRHPASNNSPFTLDAAIHGDIVIGTSSITNNTGVNTTLLIIESFGDT